VKFLARPAVWLLGREPHFRGIIYVCGALPRRRYGRLALAKKRACHRGGRSYSGTNHEKAFGQGEKWGLTPGAKQLGIFNGYSGNFVATKAAAFS